MLLSLALLLGPLGALPPDAGSPSTEATVPAADVAAETAWLTSLGLSVPDGGVVLEKPYAPPLTRRSFVVPHTWFKNTPDTVSAAALARDLDVLHEAMSRAYGGWETAQARGWKWDAWFSEWKASLLARGDATLSLEEAFAPVKQLLAFQLDNHTNIPLSSHTYFGSGSVSVRLGLRPQGVCTEARTESGLTFSLSPNDKGQQPREAWAWDGKALHPTGYLAYPRNRGQVVAVRCGGEWLQTHPIWEPAPLDVFHPSPERTKAILALSKQTRDHPFLTHLTPAVAYVRFPTFSKENAVEIAQHLASWRKPTAQDKVLIVDLRDNEGGDAAVEALAAWVDPERLKAGLHGTTHRGASCLYFPFRWGYMVFTSSHLSPPLPADMAHGFQEMLDALFVPAEADCPRRSQDEVGTWNYAQRHVAPPGPVDGHRRIIALVNNGCGSDCEYMTYLLASLPETVVVGTNTYGVAQYIQPGYSVLPQTGLAFRMALGTSDLYGDQRSVDGYGLDVDVLLATKAYASPASILRLAEYFAGRH